MLIFDTKDSKFLAVIAFFWFSPSNGNNTYFHYFKKNMFSRISVEEDLANDTALLITTTCDLSKIYNYDYDVFEKDKHKKINNNLIMLF